ncbi:MAG: hypothetical protein U1A78_04245 [Polyangia bacterium]
MSPQSRQPVGLRRRLGARGAAGLLGALLLWGGCYAEEIAELRSQVDRLSMCQRCAQSQMTQGLALALCRAPVRQLIDDVAQVCRSNDVCLDQKIATLVGDADPTHLGKFVGMMDQQRHVVLYFSPKDTLIDGPESVYMQRLKKLVQPQPPWLPTTKFLVVSNLPPPALTAPSRLSTQDPAVQRAERRGLQIIEKILEFGFDRTERLAAAAPAAPAAAPATAPAPKPADAKPLRVNRDQILHWVYSFSLKKGEYLRKDDMGLPGSDLSLSVWVFRIDCATPTEFTEPAGCAECLGSQPPLQPLP